MLNIINKGYKKILELFYTDKNTKYHLREIARKTKLNENSAFRFLNNLEKNAILTSERDANLKKYSLSNNKQTNTILAAFDIEKFNKIPNRKKNAISTYLKNLPEQPVFVILFGSTAKETYREDSDIDILLITNSKIQTKNAEKEADTITATKISTFQITYKNFLQELKLKEDKVVQSAINTGYPLINHIRYYEDLNNERI